MDSEKNNHRKQYSNNEVNENDHSSAFQVDFILLTNWLTERLIIEALGTVKDSFYDKVLRPLVVEFYYYHRPFITERLFPITSVSESLK